jgi:hypothetical protein
MAEEPGLPTADDIAALAASVERLGTIAEQAEAEARSVRLVAEGAVPREVFARRLAASFVAVLVVSALLAFGAWQVSNATRDRTLRQLNANLTRCFVRPAALTSDDARYCARPEVFGDLFATTQAQSAAALRENQAREERLATLERKVATLQRERDASTP